MAVCVVLSMATREFHVTQYYHTTTAIFSARSFLARMAAGLMSALTMLFALEDLMHCLRVATRLASMTTIWKTVHTSFSTASFGTELGKVFRLLYLDCRLCVSWAAELQSWPDTVLGAQHIDDLLPHRHIGVRVSVADEVHSMLSSTQQNVDAICSLEKPNLPLSIAPNQSDDNNFSLLTLEIVNSGYTEKITQFLLL
jgi:hypothetical protein